MDLETAIRTRRTHKAYRPEPVAREMLDELFELARWAPNHHLTSPWRFRVIGPRALERAEGRGRPRGGAEARPGADARRLLGGRHRRSEPRTTRTCSPTGCAAYIVLLAAHARGLAGYWRTPGVLREPAGRAAVGMPGLGALRRPPLPAARRSRSSARPSARRSTTRSPTSP